MVPTLLGLRVFFANTLAVVGIGIILLAPLAVLGNQGAEQNGTVGSSHLAAHGVAVQSRGAPHAPIHISGNDDFASQAANERWPGDGTEQNPYIIAGYEIDGNGGCACIWIENTDVWFIVRDCKVWNATDAVWEPWGTGIFMLNVTHGTLDKNTCSGNRGFGIYLKYSNNNIITNNTCSGNTRGGIFLKWSSNNPITNNNCSSNGNGIYLDNSNNNPITSNTCLGNGYGIYLDDSSNNPITNNNCSGNRNGIAMSYSGNNNNITNNRCYNNSHTGITIHCSNIVITHNICVYNSIGMEISGGNLFIMYNNCSYNYDVGIQISTSDSVIANNDLYRNKGHGVECSGSHNQIHHNNFIENNGATSPAIPYSQALDYGTNLWYNPETKEGNYWSNWNGKGAYKIDGYGEDPYPLGYKVGEESMEWLYWLIAIIVITVIVICIAIIVLRTHKKKRMEVEAMEGSGVELENRETAVPVAQGEKMVCSRCGAVIPSDANYCPFCASKVR